MVYLSKWVKPNQPLVSILSDLRIRSKKSLFQQLNYILRFLHRYLFTSQHNNIIKFIMDCCFQIQPSSSQKVIPINPETDEQRCRICYEQTKPLITLCECSGSIAFVHQECILDWITKKMESSQTVQIPTCQICRTVYSARLKIGCKKICPKLLIRKLKEQKAQHLIYLFFCLVGIIFAVVSASTAIFSIIANLITSASQSHAQSSPSSTSSSDQGAVTKLFKNMVFPIFFVKAALIYGKRHLKIFEESRVKLVEVTLSPKLIIKQ